MTTKISKYRLDVSQLYVTSYSLNLLSKKSKHIFFEIFRFIFRKIIFQNMNRNFRKMFLANLRSVTRCNFKPFGSMLKLNLGGDRFLSLKSSKTIYWTARKILPSKQKKVSCNSYLPYSTYYVNFSTNFDIIK